MKYELKKPLQIETATSTLEIKELELDFDALSLADMKTANKIKSMIADAALDSIDNSTISPRLDSDLRIGISWCAAMKGTKGITFTDVLRLSLADCLQLSEIALQEYLL